MRLICALFCLSAIVNLALPAPANGFFFPEERQQRKIEPVITPPVLPVLEHLERDPSTLLPHERRSTNVKPRFGGGFNVGPSGNGGLTASISSSSGGNGGSQSASQSFSFGFNEGFSASHSASQAASFNGFGSSFSGSQASSQAASFSGNGVTASGASSSAASIGGSGFGGSGTGSQSASSAFGFNNLNGFQPHGASFGDEVFDLRQFRHRGVPNFHFPEFLGKGVGAAAFRNRKGPSGRSRDGLITTIVLED